MICNFFILESKHGYACALKYFCAYAVVFFRIRAFVLMPVQFYYQFGC